MMWRLFRTHTSKCVIPIATLLIHPMWTTEWILCIFFSHWINTLQLAKYPTAGGGGYIELGPAIIEFVGKAVIGLQSSTFVATGDGNGGSSTNQPATISINLYEKNEFTFRLPLGFKIFKAKSMGNSYWERDGEMRVLISDSNWRRRWWEAVEVYD